MDLRAEGMRAFAVENTSEALADRMAYLHQSFQDWWAPCTARWKDHEPSSVHLLALLVAEHRDVHQHTASSAQIVDPEKRRTAACADRT